MSKAPAFQFYPKDWLTDDKVMAMTYDEQGRYIEMLSLQWLHNGLTEVLFSNKAVTLLLQSCFNVCDDGKYRNPKLESIRDELNKFKKQKSDAGKKGMKARYSQQKLNSVKKVLVTEPITKSNPAFVSAFASASTSSTASTENILPDVDDFGDPFKLDDNSPGAIVAYYQEKVKPGDTNRGARAVCELIANGYKPEHLIACIDNYVAWHDFPLKKFRKDVGNFFGEDARFEDFSKPIEKPVEETNVDNFPEYEEL